MKKIFFILFMFGAMNSFCQRKAFKAEVYGKGQPIILIPGYACSGAVWNATVASLKANYQLHVLTIAGYASVSAIDSPILKTVKNELIQYVKENHLNKPVLIGHGLGVFMCLWAASEEPFLFSKILCVNGVPFISGMPNASINVQLIKNNPYYNAETLAKHFEKMPDNAFAEIQFKKIKTMVGDSAHARLITSWAIESDRKTLGYTYVEMAATDLRQDISKINIPVLILGRTYGTKEASLKLFSDQYMRLPNKSIIIAPTKDFIMYDDPIWFREQVKNFLTNDIKN